MLKIAFRNITKKTKRTTLTLIAIAMLSAICYASCGLIHNIIQFTQDETSSDLGNVHYVVFKDEDITLSNHYIVNKEYDLGLGNYNNITYALRRLENDQLFPFTIEEGRFPTNNHEVLVNRNLGITVGNAIELFYKNQLFSFDVVGVYEPSELNEEAIYVHLNGGKLNTYYISDRQLELSDNVEGIAELMNVIPEDVIVNDALISQSLLKQ